MKKFVALSLALTMALSLAACGGDTTSSGGDTSGTGESSSSDGVTLRLVNGKIEVDEQLKKLAELYKEETGVTVEIQSIGGGIDIQSELKNYYQADNMPDIFVNGSEADFANWEGLLVDMSDQPWISDTDQAYTDDSGAVLGFPYTTEAIGMAYNADILEKAGVDPSTLTTYSAYKEAFEKIDSMKDELGLTAVVDLGCESTNLYWSTGNHLFGQYLSAGLDRDDKTYIDLLSDGGQLDTERFTEYANFFQLLIDYSDPTMAVSGTYDEQILQFASGKYAFVTQGSWIGATMTSTDFNDLISQYLLSGGGCAAARWSFWYGRDPGGFPPRFRVMPVHQSEWSNSHAEHQQNLAARGIDRGHGLWYCTDHPVPGPGVHRKHAVLPRSSAGDWCSRLFPGPVSVSHRLSPQDHRQRDFSVSAAVHLCGDRHPALCPGHLLLPDRRHPRPHDGQHHLLQRYRDAGAEHLQDGGLQERLRHGSGKGGPVLHHAGRGIADPGPHQQQEGG